MTTTDASTTFAQLKEATRAFAQERDWEQFHAPKNLSMAIAAEAAELMEPFLWSSAADSHALCADPQKRKLIESELADILIFSFQFANVAKIDIASVVQAKIAQNAVNYPVAKAKGRSEKYTEL